MGPASQTFVGRGATGLLTEPKPAWPTSAELKPSTRAEPVARAGRIDAIDAARTIAAMAVIWAHWVPVEDAPQWQRVFGLVAVPYFTSAAMGFAARQTFAERPVAELVRTRMHRIMWPFVVWCGVYYLLTYVISGWMISGVQPQFRWDEFRAGFSGRLWFLPFIFLTGVAAVLLCRLARASSGLSVLMLLGSSFAVGALVVQPFHAGGGDGLWRWLYEVPVVLTALGLGLAVERGWLRLRRSALVCAAGVCGVAALLALSAWVEDYPERRLCQAAGLLLYVTALATPNRIVPRWMTRLGAMGFSVYVSHMIIVLVGDRLLGDKSARPLWLSLVTLPLLLAASFGFAAVLRRVPGVRQIMP
jgi:fucose 4-O-acetylase-like acetyltransferase